MELQILPIPVLQTRIYMYFFCIYICKVKLIHKILCTVNIDENEETED